MFAFTTLPSNSPNSRGSLNRSITSSKVMVSIDWLGLKLANCAFFLLPYLQFVPLVHSDQCERLLFRRFLDVLLNNVLLKHVQSALKYLQQFCGKDHRNS